MERYAVLNVGSGEILSPWYTTEERAHKVAAECESHETQPDCEVVRFSEWAVGRRLVAESIDFAMPDDVYPVVYDNGNGTWLMTGEIVSAQEARYEVTECGMAMFEREG